MAGTTTKEPRLDSDPRPKPTPKPRAKAKAKPKVKPKPKAVMYASKKLVMFHPAQGIRFIPGSPVECRKDGWLEGQIKAGLIKEV